MKKKRFISVVISVALVFLPSYSFSKANINTTTSIPKPAIQSPELQRALKRMMLQLNKADNSTKLKKIEQNTDNKTIAEQQQKEKIKPLRQKKKKTVKIKLNKHDKVFFTLEKVNIKQNSSSIQFKGSVKYHVFTVGNSVVAIDFVNPKIVGFCYGKYVCRFTPPQHSIFKSVISAKHYSKCDREIYGKPFLRVSYALKNDVVSFKYKVEKQNNKINIVFYNIKIKKKALLKKKTNTKSGDTPKPVLAQTVKISLKNISCFVSPYKVKQVLYSKENGIQIKVINNRVFIKPLPKKVLGIDGTYSYVYSKSEKDIYIVTDRRVYSLNLIPTDMPSITYILPSVKEQKIKEESPNGSSAVSSYFFSREPAKVDASSYVSYLLSLIKNIYNHKIPDGYIMYPYTKKYDYLQITIKGEYLFKSSKYTVYLMKITARQPVRLDAVQFANLFQRPLALTVIKPTLDKGETTYLIAVTKEASNE